MAESAIRGGVAAAVPHDSAHKHVSGEAIYIDDLPEPSGILHAAVGLSTKAHAEILRMDLDPVRAAPGVVAVVSAADVPGSNDIGPVFPGDPLFAEGVVEYAGQALFAVAAATVEQARRAARLARVEYRELEAILTVEDALAKEATVVPSHAMRRGDPEAALAGAPHRLVGPHQDGRPGAFLSGRPGCARPAGRGRRHAGLELDPASERGAAPDRQGAGPAAPRDHRRGAAHGRRFRRQGDPGGAVCVHGRSACPPHRGARSSSGSIATTTCCSPASATTS